MLLGVVGGSQLNQTGAASHCEEEVGGFAATVPVGVLSAEDGIQVHSRSIMLRRGAVARASSSTRQFRGYHVAVSAV